jgi:cytochrome c oxidase assembly protein subunit 11
VNEAVRQKNQRLVLKLLLLVIGMIGVGIALIPLYDVLTDMSGMNGKLKVSVEPQQPNFTIDQTRAIHVDLLVSVGKDTPITFVAETKKLQIHPGQVYTLHYSAQNTSDKAIVGHASPSVTPGLAAAHFKVLECFCAGNQDFRAGEVKQLQLRFALDPKLPVQTKNIALALQYFKTK